MAVVLVKPAPLLPSNGTPVFKHSATVTVVRTSFSPLMQSVGALCPGSKQVMIYGGKFCKYQEIFAALQKEIAPEQNSPVQRVFDWDLGNRESSGEKVTTLEGHTINNLVYRDGNILQRTSRPCKTAITDLVLENYFRLALSEPIIPLVFCYKIQNNKYPFSLKNITSKKTTFNKMQAYKELRRMLSLCIDPVLHSKIRETAQRTFVFVNVKTAADGSVHSVEKIDSPFNSPDAAKLWKARKKSSKVLPKTDRFSWRLQIALLMALFHEQRDEKVPESEKPPVEPKTPFCPCLPFV